MADKRILVVEDSPTMRQLIAFTLRRLPNIALVEATDGVDALRKLGGDSFDLIFTDINMPIMDGLKLVSLVRSDPALRHIPIVIITTEGAAEDRQRGLALGANDYLIKPIQASRILAAARELLNIA
ncbi:response regulator [Geobacter hydrogenophilus]|uniref:Response regulator n=1 Tax=Geobacter hydrogenophilus TaxID=40983 RepID=A0A9W6G2D6_9BACT|nr:response regulator [Geobacter hydrogenophilus]MBT0892256.1 response regulator [Geobacter hydrogenophilus]GLI39649.1 response regulator [Geobacter hydrogenophilus]